MPIGAQSVHVHRALLDLHYVAAWRVRGRNFQWSQEIVSGCKCPQYQSIRALSCIVVDAGHAVAAATSSALESILNGSKVHRCGSPLARIGRVFMKPDTIFPNALLRFFRY